MNEGIRLGIAEDHELVRQGLLALLEDEQQIKLVFDVSNGSLLLKELEQTTVDVVLLDLDMPVMTGQQALEVIQVKFPEVKCLIISMHYSPMFIQQCLKLGAHGFLPKNSSREVLIDAILSVHYQGFYFDDTITPELLKKALKGKNFKVEIDEELLTQREVEIVRLICDGMKNSEIADAMGISLRTVEVHRKNITDKTKATNVAGVVVYAIKKGIYKLS